MSPEPVGVTGGSDNGSGGASPASSGSSSTSAVVERPSPAGASSGDATGTSGVEIADVKYERFKEVNDKYVRLKGWEDFGDADPQEVRQQVALAKWANDNPREFFEWYSGQMRANGYIQEPTPQPGRQPTQEGPPGPDRRDPATGDTYYSAPQLEKLLKYQNDQLDAKLNQRLGPTEQFVGSAGAQMRARQEAQQILREASQWPHFEANKAAIFDEMQKHARNRMSLETAYRRVVIPTLEARARQDVIASTEHKIGATTHSPSTSQGAGKEDLTKLPFRTLLQREFRKRGLGR